MDRKGKIAILLGASGVVGGFLLQYLLESGFYSKIIVFVRKGFFVDHPKLEVHVIDFDELGSFAHLVFGDDLYCCLGTTMGKAGSQEQFRKVDCQYPLQFAAIAAENGVKQYLLVSSIGADSHSSVFYLRTKGECEDGIKRIGIESVSVFRPSFLIGDRKEFRLNEKLSLPFLRLFSFLLVGKLKRYRPIKAREVAKAMYNAALVSELGFNIYNSDDISD